MYFFDNFLLLLRGRVAYESNSEFTPLFYSSISSTQFDMLQSVTLGHSQDRVLDVESLEVIDWW